MAVTDKISVTLPKPDIAFLAQYMERTGTSRSGALHDAVKALRDRFLEDAYHQADDEWQQSGEADVWDVTIADGLDA